MVVLKRKPTNETEKSVGYDDVIELDERKSYNASQKETAEAGLFTKREAFVSNKPSQEVMPKINVERKEVVMPKQVVSSKTKVLLAAYIIIAVILAAVVIGTGVAISEAGKRAADLENQVGRVATQVESQSIELHNLNNDTWLGGKALEYDMEKIDEVVTVQLVSTVDVQEYSGSGNWFDRLCDFLSKIFN